jgi:hypothetical protein
VSARKSNELMKALHAKRRAEGICIYGDGPAAPGRGGRCDHHADLKLESERRIRERQRQHRRQGAAA